jgi:hypothetical protein
LQINSARQNQDPKSNSQIKTHVNGGGQECPPHTGG